MCVIVQYSNTYCTAILDLARSSTASQRYTSEGQRRREEEGRADATDSEEELDALLLEMVH